MLLDDTLADGQTEARSLPDLFRGKKWIEDLRKMLRSNPTARIGYEHIDPFLFTC
jgi:hypothetical protein